MSALDEIATHLAVLDAFSADHARRLTALEQGAVASLEPRIRSLEGVEGQHSVHHEHLAARLEALEAHRDAGPSPRLVRSLAREVAEMLEAAPGALQFGDKTDAWESAQDAARQEGEASLRGDTLLTDDPSDPGGAGDRLGCKTVSTASRPVASAADPGGVGGQVAAPDSPPGFRTSIASAADHFSDLRQYNLEYQAGLDLITARDEAIKARLNRDWMDAVDSGRADRDGYLRGLRWALLAMGASEGDCSLFEFKANAEIERVEKGDV